MGHMKNKIVSTTAVNRVLPKALLTKLTYAWKVDGDVGRPLFSTLKDVAKAVVQISAQYKNAETLTSVLSNALKPDSANPQELKEALRNDLLQVSLALLEAEGHAEFKRLFERSFQDLELAKAQAAGRPGVSSTYDVRRMIAGDMEVYLVGRMTYLTDAIMERMRLNVLCAMLMGNHTKMTVYFEKESDERSFWIVLKELMMRKVLDELKSGWSEEDLIAKLQLIRETGALRTIVDPSVSEPTPNPRCLVLKDRIGQVVDLADRTCTLRLAGPADLKWASLGELTAASVAEPLTGDVVVGAPEILVQEMPGSVDGQISRTRLELLKTGMSKVGAGRAISASHK